MKRETLQKVEHFMRHELKTKIRNDLTALRITKEADAECCLFYHLRRTLPAKGAWKVLAIKHTRKTGYYIDILVFEGYDPRLAIEIKWNRKGMPDKDRKSLDCALTLLRVNKAYFVSVGPDLSKYKRLRRKKKVEKNRLHEIPIYLSTHSRKRLKEWKAKRNRFGGAMRTGSAKPKWDS
jgi:hypothetical protein